MHQVHTPFIFLFSNLCSSTRVRVRRVVRRADEVSAQPSTLWPFILICHQLARCPLEQLGRAVRARVAIDATHKTRALDKTAASPVGVRAHPESVEPCASAVQHKSQPEAQTHSAPAP